MVVEIRDWCQNVGEYNTYNFCIWHFGLCVIVSKIDRCRSSDPPYEIAINPWWRGGRGLPSLIALFYMHTMFILSFYRCKYGSNDKLFLFLHANDMTGFIPQSENITIIGISIYVQSENSTILELAYMYGHVYVLQGVSRTSSSNHLGIENMANHVGFFLYVIMFLWVIIRKYWLVLRWICNFVAPRNGNIPPGVAEWNISITRGNKTAYAPKMDQSIFPLLYFVYWSKVDDYFYNLLTCIAIWSVHVYGIFSNIIYM